MDEKKLHDVDALQGPEDRKKQKAESPECIPAKIASLLNEVLRVDPISLHKLIDNRVFCSSELEDHPTICVEKDEETGISQLGILGLLNGLCEGKHKVVMYYEPIEETIQYFDILDVEALDKFQEGNDE